MTAERFTDPIDRVLKIAGRVSEETLNRVNLTEPEVSSEPSQYNITNCRALFFCNSYATIPIGKQYEIVFPFRTPSIGTEVYTEVIAATSITGEVLISLPDNWRTIALVYFQSGVPPIIDSIPVVDEWANLDNPLCLSSKETWSLRCDKQFGKL